jgi:hypothetical protein
VVLGGAGGDRDRGAGGVARRDHARTPALVRKLGALVLAGVVAGVALWPLARPFLGTPPASRDEARSFSLEARDFVTPTPDTVTGALLGARRAPGVAWTDDRAYAVGPVAGAAAIAGVLATLALGLGRSLLWAAPLGAIGFLLALGPSPPGGAWHLFDLLGGLPGLSSFRAPFRMAVLVSFAAAVLIGIAVRAVPARARTAAVAGLLVLLTAEGYGAFLPPTTPHARPLPVPGIFANLEAERPSALLVVPMLAGTAAWPSEADYMQMMLPTWTPLANGYGRRTPAIYEALREAAAGPPRGLAEALRFYGISHVAVLSAYGEDRAAAFTAGADTSPDFQRVAGGGGDVLYRVRAAR